MASGYCLKVDIEYCHCCMHLHFTETSYIGSNLINQHEIRSWKDFNLDSDSAIY